MEAQKVDSGRGHKKRLGDCTELGIFEEQMSPLEQNREGKWKEMRLEDSRVIGSQGEGFQQGRGMVQLAFMRIT